MSGARALGAWTLLATAALGSSGHAEQPPPNAPNFGGTYVMLQQTATLADVPVLADIEATTRAISVLTLQHEGGRLVGKGPLCSLKLENDSSLVKTELPDAFRRSLPPVELDAEIAPFAGGYSFRQPERTLVVGARLAPGAPLPTRADDKRVYDQDRDGKPGVTVRVSGVVSGDIYLVQRSRSRLYGSLRGAAFTGRVEFENEQRVLGSSHPLLGEGPSSRPVPERSFFRLERVEAGSGCEVAERLAGRWR